MTTAVTRALGRCETRFGASCMIIVLGLVACKSSGSDGMAMTHDARVVDAADMADASGTDAHQPLDATPPDAGADDGSTDAASDGASTDATSPSEPLTWESVETTTDDGTILIEKVAYVSDGLLVVGQVCRPTGSGPFPVQIINHGGFSGIGAWNGGPCANAARNGWVAAEASYRGEDDSEGTIEVCLGEVTDVLRITDIVLAQSYADPQRVLMSGGSHGGCITTRAVQRGAPVHAAIDIFGPTDWAAAFHGWRDAIAAGSTLSPLYTSLMTTLQTATGGAPEQFSAAYAARSPVTYSAALSARDVPFLILQAGADAYVPNAQSCALAAAAGGFHAYHVTVTGTVTTSVPTGCEGMNLQWLDGPRPSTDWPHHRYLLVYDDVGHNFEGTGTPHLFQDFIAFIADRFPR